jgi:hypothetical protein
MHNSKLTYYLAISGETPREYLNAWDSDTRDIENALARYLPADMLSQIDSGYKPIPESEFFYGFDELDQNGEFHYVHFYGEVSRDVAEYLARDGYFSGATCDTLGILCARGGLPALSFDVYMPKSWISLYVCPLYGGEVPTEASFHRALRALSNL